MEEQEIHLRDYYLVIRKRKVTVFIFFFITVVTVLLGTLSATPLYESTIKLLVEKSNTQQLASYAMPQWMDPAFIENQSQIITSSRVTEKVVLDLDLLEKKRALNKGKKDNIFKSSKNWLKGHIKTIKDFFVFDDTSEGNTNHGKGDAITPEKALALQISTSLNINPTPDSNILTVSYTEEDPVLARDVISAVVKAYMDELLEIKMHSSGYAIKWMTAKAGEQREKLANSEQDLQRYMKSQDMVTIEDKITILPQKLAQVGGQLTQAEAKRKELEILYSRIKKAAKAGLASIETIPVIAESAEVRSVRDEIHLTEQKITELSKKYGYKHPVMIKAVSEKQILLEKKSAAVRLAVDSIKNDYEFSVENEESLRNRLASVKAKTLGLNEKYIQYGVLKREVESNKVLYESLLARLKEQDITEETQTVNVWVVEEAQVPEDPSSPNKKRNLLLGLVLGVFGGVGLAFFIEYMDNTIKSPDDGEQRTGLSVLGVVENRKIPGNGKLKEITALEDPRCSFAESFKVLRTSLLLSSATNPPKSIVVSSMVPEEGKTTTAVNLAVTIAQAGQSVLLIDSDMRKPRIHKLFSLENSKGLSTYLAGASDSDLIKEGPIEGLKIITSGPIPPNPSELLISDKLEKMVREYQEMFDIVIFDSAPIVSVTDTLIVSKNVEGMVIVARAERTTYDLINKGLKSLNDIDINVLGMVVNCFNVKKNKYYYGKYYTYSYGNYGVES